MNQQWRRNHFGMIFVANFLTYASLCFIFTYVLFGYLVKPAEPEVSILLTVLFIPQWISSAIGDPVIKYGL